MTISTPDDGPILIVDPRSCRRLRGGHVRECICFLHAPPWFAQCPPEARGLLVPVENRPGPPTLDAGAAEKPPEPEPPIACVSIFAVGDSVRPAGGFVTRADVIAREYPPGSPAPVMTGEMCESCQSFNTRRIGTCLQCLDCYAEGGCG